MIDFSFTLKISTGIVCLVKVVGRRGSAFLIFVAATFPNSAKIGFTHFLFDGFLEKVGYKGQNISVEIVGRIWKVPTVRKSWLVLNWSSADLSSWRYS